MLSLLQLLKFIYFTHQVHCGQANTRYDRSGHLASVHTERTRFTAFVLPIPLYWLVFWRAQPFSHAHDLVRVETRVTTRVDEGIAAAQLKMTWESSLGLLLPWG